MNTTAPELTNFQLPDIIDLSQGDALIDIVASATDDLSGIEDVRVRLDQSISYDYEIRTTQFFSHRNSMGLPGIEDGWDDGVVQEDFLISQYNIPGIYTVSSVEVTDIAGNTRIYTASELAALGFDTEMIVSGPTVPDGAPVARFESAGEIVEGQTENALLVFENLQDISFTYEIRVVLDGSADMSDVA